MGEFKMDILKVDRHTRILEILRDQKRVNVSELVRLFNTTGATIRRDLRRLEEEGILHRTYGGAVSNDKVGFEFSFREKMSKFMEEKRRIGKFASTLIEDGDTVIIESGTTCLCLAKNIKHRKNMTVVTNALDIVSELHACSGIRIILLGGIYLSEAFCTVGPFLGKVITDLYVDKVFLGANGVSIERGLTAVDERVAHVNRLMIESARECIVITDHSKIGKVCFATIVPVTKINKLIVDNGIKEEDKIALEEKGVEVIIV